MRLSWLFPVLLAATVGCGQQTTSQPTASQPTASQPTASQPTASQPTPPASGSKAEGPMVIKPGGIYSCTSGNGAFSIVKVLVVEDGGVHARLHTNRYNERPTAIDPKELKVAIGHVPLS